MCDFVDFRWQDGQVVSAVCTRGADVVGKDSVPPLELDIRRPNWSSEEFAPESDSLPLLPFADSEKAMTDAEGDEKDTREGAGDLYAVE